MRIFKLIIGSVTLFLFSCENQVSTSVNEDLFSENTNTIAVIEQPALSNYFETDKIKIDTLSHILTVTIMNSILLESKKKKMGSRWESPEPWISVAATHQSKQLSKTIDSLVYEVKVGEKKNSYSYSVKQLKKANHYLSICEQFSTCLNRNDYNAIKELLSVEITSKYSDTQITSFLISIFEKKQINHIELIGAKIVEGKYSFYINFWYPTDKIQTYVFSFIEGDDKIAGIQIPK